MINKHQDLFWGDPTITEQWYQLGGDPTIPNPRDAGRSYNNKCARASREMLRSINIRIYFRETLQ